jgi:ABC transport system ATP-binding/permease protein
VDESQLSTSVGAELAVVVDDSRVVARPDQPVLIGREAGCTLRVQHPLVSRKHADVTWTGNGWLLRDLGSSNGTYLDGKQVQTLPVNGPVQVRLGSAEDGPVVRLEPPPVDMGAATRPVARTPEGPPATVAIPAPRPARAEPPRSPAPPGVTVATPPPASIAKGVAAVAGRVPTAEHAAAGLVRIGRDEANDIVLRDLGVSRRHAEVRPGPGGFEVIDLGSRNGTYLNGKQVSRAPLAEGDLISIGRHRFVFERQRLRQYVDTGPVSLVADDLTVRVGKKVLLDDVTFALPQASLLAVIGPSGCGKSTLVRAMTGLRPATLGRVRYDGRDLYADYAELRYRIGVVPQDDVLHRQLTVRRALRFAAALRFADDVPRKQRWARVDEVIETLGLTERANERIDNLSGGQRKRVSVALELLTEPSLLFLDEPTSGLDPALDKEVMEELREIADSGRTVTVVTHSVLHLDICDRVLVLCKGGTMGYFGPPDEVLDFFGAKDYAEVFRNVTDDPEKWSRRYRGSELYRRYVLEVMGAADEMRGVPARPVPAPVLGSPSPLLVPGAPKVEAVKPKIGALPLAKRVLHPAAPLRHFATLSARMLAIITADRGYALFLLGLPVALAVVSRTVPGNDGLAPPPGGGHSLEAQRLLVVLVVGAAFLGVASAIREIVGEAPIYRRERAVGLSPGAYLGSKVAVFAIINTIQVILLVYLSLFGRPKPPEPLVLSSPVAELVVALALVALACTALGLLVSSLVKTTEQTTPVLVVSVMAQLVLSAGLFELDGQAVLNQVSWLSPTRWGFAAGAGTVDLHRITRLNDPLWTHSVSSWWRAVALLLVQTVVLVAGTRLALRRHEPGR